MLRSAYLSSSICRNRASLSSPSPTTYAACRAARCRWYSVLEPSTHQTYCPYKGVATYFTLRHGDRIADDAVWRYESPYDAVAPIAGHVAFYPQHVSIEQFPA